MSDGNEGRLHSIESRLSEIEKCLGLPEKEYTTSVNDPGAQSPATSVKEAPSPLVPSEENAGNWLGIVAVICFVLAAGFIVKLSIESGWLTPTRQIGLAALLGLSLIVIGFALMKTYREYASLLPGAGIIVLYLTTFAAHRYYSLISFEVAIALVSLVSGLCIWLYAQIKHDIYAITAATGAYLAPLILDLSTDAEFSLYYFLLCSIAFAFISIWVQSRTLTLISAYLAICMSAIVGFDIHQDMFVACVLAINFLVFALGTYLYTTQSHIPLSEQEAWSFLPVLLAFYAMEYYFIDRIQPGLAPWISLGFAGILIGLYLSARKYFPDNLGSQSLVLAFTTIVCFHSVYIELLPVNARSWLFVAIMFSFAFLPFKTSAQTRSGPLVIPLFAVLAILAIEYLTMLFYLFDKDESSWLIVSFAAFASLWAAITKAQNGVSEQNKYGTALLGAAHLLAVLGLYRLTTDMGSLAVSASWLFYAVGVMAFAFSRKDEVMAKSALFVLAFAAGKALLCDAASAPTIVRILCLLLTGAVLYGCGLLMQKIASWQKHVA